MTQDPKRTGHDKKDEATYLTTEAFYAAIGFIALMVIVSLVEGIGFLL